MMTSESRLSWSYVNEIRQLLRPYRENFRKAVIWIVAMQLLALVEPFLLMAVIDDITHHQTGAHARILPLVAIAFALLLLTTWIKIVKDRKVRKVAWELFHDLPIGCMRKLLRLPLAYHQSEHVGEILTSVSSGTGKVTDLCWILFFEAIPIFVQTAVVIVSISWLHWSFTLIVTVTMAIFFYLLVTVKNRWAPQRRVRHEIMRKSERLFSQAVLNVMTVQAYNREQAEIARTKEQRTRQRDMFYQELEAYDRSNFSRNALVNFARVGLIALAAYLVFGHILSLGQIVFVSMLTERLFNVCFQFGGMYDRAIDTVEPVRVMTKLLAESEAVADPNPSWTINSSKIAIELDQVTYAYPNRPNEPALRDLSVMIEPGMMVGIVGESGHGKSTLAKLLLRFDDPTVGAIKFNGLDLRRCKKADVRKLIGYVPQEVELFDDTIQANIRYGNPEATDQEVLRAARMAHAHGFIAELEKRYETEIGSRGLRLSGGQRQRIGIARAILMDPSIMIFDEATNSVDPETIHEIKSAMHELRRERTLIVITHQISTIQDADLILVLKNGRIDGVGKHAELLRTNGVYTNFVRRQQNADAAMHVTNPNTLS